MFKRKSKRKNNNSNKNDSNPSNANGADAIRSKKVEAIKKQLKIGRLRNKDLKNQNSLSKVIKGEAKNIMTIQGNDIRMTIFKDDDGVKLRIRDVKKGKEKELADTIRAALERTEYQMEAGPLISITSDVNDLSSIDTLNNALKEVETQFIGHKKKVATINKAELFKAFINQKLKPNQELDAYDINHIKDYFLKESGARSNQEFKKILDLLDQAIREDIALEKDSTKIQSDITNLFNISNQINALLAAAESTHRSSAKKEQRNLALRNMKTLLDHYMMSKTWASGKMTINDQKMVASAKDMDDIKDMMDEMKQKGITLTPNQAWSLVAANKKGATDSEKNRAKLENRINELNEKWGIDYTKNDIDNALRHLKEEYQVVTNYQFEKMIGDKSLAELMMSGDTFKNFWETNTSQANPDIEHRAKSEEAMGFAQEFSRKDGQQQGIAPDDASALPKYAALQSTKQIEGVQKYGNSTVVWNDNIKERSTLAPGDTFTTINQKNFTSYNHLESVLANADEPILRLAMAEAQRAITPTNEKITDNDFYEKNKSNALKGFSAYIENQIHGKLEWKDVKEIKIGYDNQKPKINEDSDRPDGYNDYDWAQKLKQDLETFRDANGLTFEIMVRDEGVYGRLPDLSNQEEQENVFTREEELTVEEGIMNPLFDEPRSAQIVLPPNSTFANADPLSAFNPPVSNVIPTRQKPPESDSSFQVIRSKNEE